MDSGGFATKQLNLHYSQRFTPFFDKATIQKSIHHQNATNLSEANAARRAGVPLFWTGRLRPPSTCYIQSCNTPSPMAASQCFETTLTDCEGRDTTTTNTLYRTKRLLPRISNSIKISIYFRSLS
ncbi:hypothetical protein ABEB36_001032 [Hypothenemus hampei]|uniref:Uncharacterized protein n=1 Tax=Hypothenemus hampei TaxID=57062 RepID=A0ABD1FD90_HYPHA